MFRDAIPSHPSRRLLPGFTWPARPAGKVLHRIELLWTTSESAPPTRTPRPWWDRCEQLLTHTILLGEFRHARPIAQCSRPLHNLRITFSGAAPSLVNFPQ